MTSISLKLSSTAIAMPFLLLATTSQAPAKNNTAAALVGGLIVGAAVGAAVSSANHPKTIYYAPPPAAPPPPPRPAWTAAFTPAPGVICYPAQQACYNNGAYAPNYTYGYFGR
jgi:D-alanyl-D-alanine carboxypeptidase